MYEFVTYLWGLVPRGSTALRPYSYDLTEYVIFKSGQETASDIYRLEAHRNNVRLICSTRRYAVHHGMFSVG